MKILFRMGLVLLAMLMFVGCGEKTKDDIVGNLEANLTELTSYQTQAKMKMQTGEQEQSYEIDVAYQAESFYRVLLKNEQDEEGSQIILKNDDGVFVLTPALNKSFRFQSDWPSNNSQPYLYHSLVSDIFNDDEAIFTSTEDYYVFETRTNYQNNNTLPYQEIYLDKDQLTPVLVKVMDQEKNTVVEVEFAAFELDLEFEEGFFEVEHNMTSGIISTPVMSEETDDDPDAFSVLYPAELYGSELVEKTEFETENGTRVVLTYQGERDFTIVQERHEVYPASMMNPEVVAGEPVSLGFTIGAQTDQAMTWTHQGIDFYLASEQLTKEEMIDVATSISEQAVK
ncbi:outer membrane lipoprotein-sorting protein [Natronobacillus azotifigens]|uniref:Outer membrane lipoprotein carrier protein LolA n=1 Tax=Natronobacillus azotifigens TaxID=472978 RepID=A0A9J6RAW9_9BACI|nr:outer membrane lipoprotein carrier protein LolA [Natronobacillus azotifigens]MCZ0702687.1 outer membrane lipoprotein carrier protein LolA [Natronobacillus azotifigens]